MQSIKMSHQEFTEFLDRQATEKKQRISFDNWNKEGTYDYCLPENISVDGFEYYWFVSQTKRKGRSMGFTNPYIIIGEHIYNNLFSRTEPKFIDKFTCGSGRDMKKSHANRIINTIRKDLIKKALSKNIPVDIKVLLEFELLPILEFKISRRTSNFSPEVISETVNVKDYANPKEAKKYAEFLAKRFSEMGFISEITFLTDKGWFFHKYYKPKTP